MRYSLKFMSGALGLTILILISVLTLTSTAHITQAQTSVITAQCGRSNINVSINVPSNLSKGVAIVALFKVVNGSEEIYRSYIVWVVGGDHVCVNMTNVPSGEYVLKAMLWNGMLINLRSSKSPWISIKYYECEVTIHS